MDYDVDPARLVKSTHDTIQQALNRAGDYYLDRHLRLEQDPTPPVIWLLSEAEIELLAERTSDDPTAVGRVLHDHFNAHLRSIELAKEKT